MNNFGGYAKNPYFEGRYCLLVVSDSGQLDIRYSEFPGAELTQNIQNIS
jgi:hypothetical protein